MAKADAKNPVRTLVIDKWNGRLTRYRDGDINSGFANFYAAWGFDTFQRSGTLSFLAAPVDITKGVITDLVMAGKIRVESGSTYMYAIGHTGRLYKIQINDSTTYNPDYDNPVLLATLANGQTFKYGASLDFYQGSGTEKIWIGHDAGITKINFDGTGETNLTSGWNANVPRQSAQFIGSIFFTNGSNLSKVDSSETVTHNVISPGFPSNTQARDLDITADGKYLVAVVTRNPVGDATAVAPNISDIASMPSTLIYWNGVDQAASYATTFPSFTMAAYQTFGQYEYLFGYQIGGAMLGTPSNVIVVDEFTNPPVPNAIGSSGDFVGWGNTIFIPTTGHTCALLSLYGTIDAETPVGQYRQYILPSTLSGGDVVRVPFYSTVSSFETAGSTSGYTTAPFNLFGTGKTYFSTLEYNNPTTKYGFYSFKNVSDYLNTSGTGVYETQHQIFTKKIKPVEVRVYMEPTAYTSFQIDLVGIDGSVISGSTKLFTPLATDDTAQYTPYTKPTSALGLRITNAGVVTPLIHRVEIDYVQSGK